MATTTHQARTRVIIDAAKSAGALHYSSGKPCRRGHVAPRLVSTQNCTECSTIHNAAYMDARPGYIVARYRRNGKKICAQKRARYAANPEPEKAAALKWSRDNLPRVLARNAARRALEKRATPKWADQEKITKVYKAAQDAGLTVDHVVPLRSPLVCGLHWEGNLEPIPASDNTRKGNRHWPDMP